MFGAINRFISVLDRGPEESRNTGTKGAFGFQVLRKKNEELPVEPWFDFIIGINGRTLDNGDSNLFATEVKNCAGNAINLGIWSTKGQRIREIYVQVPHDPESLGLSLQWMPLSSTEDVWHILDVAPNSPADVAGLLPYSDYVIGSPEGIVRGEAGLGELIEEYIDSPLILYVYNNEYNVTRPVTITPSRTWGGQGLLGCTLGFGALHRIPAPLDEPVQQPGETMFDFGGSDEKSGTFPPTHDPSTGPEGNGFTPISPATEKPSQADATSGSFLVPANLPTSPPTTGSAATAPTKGAASRTSGRKIRTHHHHAAPALDIDDYFKEGEEKSRKEDYSGAATTDASLPPPPKIGGRSIESPRAETRSPAPVEAGDEDE